MLLRSRQLRLAGSATRIRYYSKPSKALLALPQVATTSNAPKPMYSASLLSPVAGKQAWSSPHDPVFRDIYSSDYVEAWSLLEACIESGNLERAESVLLGFAEMSSDQGDITLAMNNYLLKLVNLNAGNPMAGEKWYRQIKRLLRTKFKPNSVTQAIMLKNAFLTPERAVLQSFIQQNASELPKILNHVEVLGVNTVCEIMKYADLDASVVDARTRTLLNALEEPVAEPVEPAPPAKSVSQSSDSSPVVAAQSQNETPVEMLDKHDEKIALPVKKPGFEELTPTGSVGLKSIRHVLSGLKLGKKDEMQLLPLLQEKNLDKENYVDFFEMSKAIPEADREEFERIIDHINERRQQAIETKGVEAARMKWREMFDRMVDQDKNTETRVKLQGIEMLLWQWHQQMLPLVMEEFEKIDEISKYASKSQVPSEIKAKNGASFSDRWEYGPFLRLAKPENLPAMTMMELLRLNSVKGVTDGIKSARAVVDVGKNVELDYRLRTHKEKERDVLKGVADRTSKRRNRAAVSNLRSKLHQLSLENKQNAWPSSLRAKIGSMLISLFLRVAKVTVYGNDPVTGKKVKGLAPAFYHTYQYRGGNKIGVLRAHKMVAKYLTGESTAAVISPQQLPMLVEPRPWTSWNEGGYYYSSSKVIRTRNSPEQLAYVKEAAKQGNLQTVYDGLNVLGQTPWTINKDMFRIVSQIWNTQQPFLDIPPDVPPHPDPKDLPAAPARDADPQIRRDYLRDCRKISLETAALYSQRCDLNYKLDIARAYLGERFYMPHNLDFRGRAYPLSPHLNHLGNDVSRSLLMFWRGKKLGPQGIDWLKIHAANLFGNSKSSLQERVQFVDENMDKVRASATNPLDSGDWWKSADEPFQFLAACIDIVKAIDSGAPEEYVSHLSVHQDGSCNGLQHYAALGGDVEGAKEVNLIPADRPQDVYSRVLEIVKERVQADADKGSEQALSVLPVLSRKVVKQTVMTHVYGVTFIGAREQIANRLRDVMENSDRVTEYASYLARKVLGAVRTLFSSAHLIQDWLGENASRITHSVVLQKGVEYNNKNKPEFISSVIWTTPLGLPIVQPYRHTKRKQVATELQTVYIEDPYAFQGVDSRKQRTAFPPNYIHSLDACHMLMSAIACSKADIDFAAVHDSYWTHAGDVALMNRNLRECFAELHSANSIENLRSEFQRRYEGLLQYVEIPADSEVAQKIMKARAEWSRLNLGASRSLKVENQFEMEKERCRQIAEGVESPIETSVSITSALEGSVLDDLISQGVNMRRAKTAKHVKETWARSTELDNSQVSQPSSEPTKLDVMDESDGSGVDLDSDSSKDSRLVRILVPLRVPEVPPRGEFNVQQVLESPYFFS